MRVGLIGLGMIGQEMALRIMAAGHKLAVYARGDGLDRVAQAGATVYLDYPAVAEQSDMLAVCVFSDMQVQSVMLDSGALKAMRPGSVLVLHTTGSPALARELGRRAPEGVAVVDATFSGGPQDTANAGLTVMAGGTAEALAFVRPVLQTYARHIHHVGPLGQGQVVKLFNNLLFATNLRNAVEMLRLCEGSGMTPATVAAIVQSCSGASYALQLFKSGRPLDLVMSGIQPYLENDVAAAMAAAAESGMDMEMFRPTAAYFSGETFA